jgi:hypothetical protein
MTKPITIFYADETQCTDWNMQMLCDHPQLATADDKSWQSKPGWYWSFGDDDYDGPYATREECERAALEAPSYTAEELYEALHREFEP